MSLSVQGWSVTLDGSVPAFPLPDARELGTGLGVAQALRRARETDPAPPSRFRPGLSRAVDELVLGALARTTEERFPSARAFAEMIAAVAAAESTSA